MSIQTMAESLAARDAGIASAVAHCNNVEPRWSDHAYTMLSCFAHLAIAPFTVETVRNWATARGLPEAVEARAWGGITRAAIANGLIEKCGYAPTVSSNGSVRALYRLVRP